MLGDKKAKVTETRRSIALLTCFFGQLPWYFDYFAESCRYNSTVDFFIISDDDKYIKPLPANVILIKKTLNEVSIIVSQKLGFEVNIAQGYKMCDFKPAYGLIFSELLKGYDFWGHTDIDIIFGNIREFITDDLLNNYDLISVRPDWLSGCFLLYRNIDKLNLLFTCSKDYKKVFCSNKHYCFDETNFAHDAFTEGKSYLEINTEIESMMHVVKKMAAVGYIKPFFDLYIIEGIPGKLMWANGRMYYRAKFEVLLYHLIHFKKQYTQKPRISPIAGSFKISTSKLYHYQPSKTLTNEL
jgi:hypothetical protein